MGFLWEGSTGARALAILRELPQGTIIRTPDFAQRLGVEARALHQLLANSVRLRLIKKVRRRGWNSVGWALGGGNDSANVERRRAPTGKPRVRRRQPLPPVPAPVSALRVHWEGVTEPPPPPPRVIEEASEPVQIPLIAPDIDDLWISRARRRRRQRAAAGRRRIAEALGIMWMQLSLPLEA